MSRSTTKRMGAGIGGPSFDGGPQYVGSPGAPATSSCAHEWENDAGTGSTNYFPASALITAGTNTIPLGTYVAPTSQDSCTGSFDTIDLHVQVYNCFATETGTSTLSNVRLTDSRTSPIRTRRHRAEAPGALRVVPEDAPVRVHREALERFTHVLAHAEGASVTHGSSASARETQSTPPRRPHTRARLKRAASRASGSSKF